MTRSLTPRFSREPEHRKLIATPSYYHFGISRIRDSGLASIKGLALRYPGYQNAELSYLIHFLNYFGVSVIGVSRLAMIRVLPLCLPGYRNAETLTGSHVSYKWTVQILPRTLGIYGPDFFATYEDKRGLRH
jgi:hypothetical protein